MHYSFQARRGDVLTLALLAPLGTIFRADSTVRLDTESGVLDRGFVLG